jgi:predicted aspartyl protease
MDVHVPPQVETALTTVGQPVPSSVTGLALIDTGATMTCVHEPILTNLGLQPVGTLSAGTATGRAQQSVYMCRLIFPVLGWTVDLPVAGVNLDGQEIATSPPQPIIALLGRNLLQMCVLIWNGPGGFWTIATSN